ncbi:MAG: limonene-1,2-epoxide hydrolase family protein [Acidimicrobiales bacterium]
MPPTTSTEIEVVEAFLAAIERLDVDAAVALLDPEIVYQNVPLPAARGVRAVEQQLRWLARYGRAFEVHWHNVAANGPIVLTERTDVLTVGPVSGAFWVCGTFEVRDGRIVLWRDRFDFVDFVLSFVRGGVKAVLQRVRPN